jgi:hypothetical protein
MNAFSYGLSQGSSERRSGIEPPLGSRKRSDGLQTSLSSPAMDSSHRDSDTPDATQGFRCDESPSRATNKTRIPHTRAGIRLVTFGRIRRHAISRDVSLRAATKCLTYGPPVSTSSRTASGHFDQVAW